MKADFAQLQRFANTGPGKDELWRGRGDELVEKIEIIGIHLPGRKVRQVSELWRKTRGRAALTMEGPIGEGMGCVTPLLRAE
jgi:hypothetical protein